MDGLRGMLFVDDPAPSVSAGSPPPPPSSQAPALLFLTDWYHELSAVLASSYLTGNPDGVEPVPDNALANGIGQHYCGAACEVAVLQAVAGGDGGGGGGGGGGEAAGPPCPSPADLALVNGAAFAPFYVTLHTTGPPPRSFITAIDGVPVSPVETTGEPVFIDVGQRVRVSLCLGGGGPVFVVSEMADASFDYSAPFNSSVAVLDFSGGVGGLAGLLLDPGQKLGGALPPATPPRTLPWKAGADRVAVADLLAVPGLVPAEVVAALDAAPKDGPGAGDSAQAGPTTAAAAKHVHDRDELDPVRISVRESMRSGTAFRPRASPGRPAAAAAGGPAPQPASHPAAFALSPPNPAKSLEFYVISNPNAANQSFFYVNGISLQPPEYGPSLLERIYGNPEGEGYQNAVPAANATVLPPASSVGWHVIDNDLGTVVDLTFINGDDGPHPIHTHGEEERGWERGRESVRARPAFRAQPFAPSLITHTFFFSLFLSQATGCLSWSPALARRPTRCGRTRTRPWQRPRRRSRNCQRRHNCRPCSRATQ